MVQNKMILLFSCFLLSSVMEATADIHEIRSNALRTVDSEALKTLNLGENTQQQIPGRKNIVTNANSLVKRQAKSIAEHSTSEIHDEAQVFFSKANMLGSPQTVFGCIFNAGNLAEEKIAQIQITFEMSLIVETNKTKVSLDNLNDNWDKDMTKKEEKYRKLYIDSTTEIFSAVNESSITAIVNKFRNESSIFQTEITKILKDITTSLTAYFDTVQALVATLKTNSATENKNASNQFKACFTKVNETLYIPIFSEFEPYEMD